MEQVSWALVTGASSGMGADFARCLASQGFDLILTARRESELRALEAEINKDNPHRKVFVLAGSLTEADFRQRLFEETRGLNVSVLINNAGFGVYGAFDTVDWHKEELMIDLDIKALIHLTKEFSIRMKARGHGYILQTASIGAYQPCPLYASYGAAKAFVFSYGLAVRTELEKTGVSVMVLNPGVTATEFFTAADNKKLSWFQKTTMMTSLRVVTKALKALFKGRAIYVPGIINRFNAHVTRLIPRLFAARTARMLMS